MAMNNIYEQAINLKIRLEDIAQKRLGPEVCNEVKQFSQAHPLVFSTILLALAFSAVPVITFICFAVVTAFFSMLCFIFIEGSILVFGGIILAAIISLITVLTTAMTIAFAIGLWVARTFHRLVCNQIAQQSRIVVLPEEDRNGAAPNSPD